MCILNLFPHNRIQINKFLESIPAYQPALSLIKYEFEQNMNNPAGRLFFVRRDPFEYPPNAQLMRDLHPVDHNDVWRRGVNAPHNVPNIARACAHYRRVQPKYKIIHRKLELERLNALNLRTLIRRHRRRARKRTSTRSMLRALFLNETALGDALWSIAALERVEGELSDFLYAICDFIGVEEHDFVNDEFENDE